MAAVSLAEARAAVEREADRALPPDDHLMRPLIGALLNLTDMADARVVELETKLATAMTRMDQEVVDRLARAAVYSVTTHVSTLIRAVLWRYVPWAMAVGAAISLVTLSVCLFAADYR